MFSLKMLVKQAFKIISRLLINTIIQRVCGLRIEAPLRIFFVSW